MLEINLFLDSSKSPRLRISKSCEHLYSLGFVTSQPQFESFPFKELNPKPGDQNLKTHTSYNMRLWQGNYITLHYSPAADLAQAGIPNACMMSWSADCVSDNPGYTIKSQESQLLRPNPNFPRESWLGYLKPRPFHAPQSQALRSFKSQTYDRQPTCMPQSSVEYLFPHPHDRQEQSTSTVAFVTLSLGWPSFSLSSQQRAHHWNFSAPHNCHAQNP